MYEMRLGLRQLQQKGLGGINQNFENSEQHRVRIILGQTGYR